MPEIDKQISIRVSSNIWKLLEKAAKTEDLTVSQIIRGLLREWADAKK